MKSPDIAPSRTSAAWQRPHWQREPEEQSFCEMLRMVRVRFLLSCWAFAAAATSSERAMTWARRDALLRHSWACLHPP